METRKTTNTNQCSLPDDLSFLPGICDISREQEPSSQALLTFKHKNCDQTQNNADARIE